MNRSPLLAPLFCLLLVGLLLVGGGCSPSIGDSCSSVVDCSTLGDRLCDTNQPEGYCTVFNCEPDNCPDNATCVAFNNELDPVCGSLNDGRYGRFGRTFCMARCNEDGDCRSGYECVRPDAWQASVVDVDTDTDDPQDTKICLAVASSEGSGGGGGGGGEGGAPNVCKPNDELGVGGLTPYEPTP